MALHPYMISSAHYATGPVRNDFHHHNEYELIFVAEGAVGIQVGQTRYTAGANTLILLANLEKHSLLPHGECYKRYCVTLHVQETDSSLPNQDLLNLLKNHTEGFPHCLDIAPIRALVLDIFTKILACKPDAPYANDLVACYITQLLIAVCRLHPELLEHAATCRDRILSVQKYLDRHYTEPLRIADICSKYYISSHYLSHQFKAMTGYSPKQYLTLLRLKHAAIRIHDTDEAISRIAEESGFTDINNFCKQFKREYGAAPTEFRKTKALR